MSLFASVDAIVFLLLTSDKEVPAEMFSSLRLIGFVSVVCTSVDTLIL